MAWMHDDFMGAGSGRSAYGDSIGTLYGAAPSSAATGVGNWMLGSGGGGNGVSGGANGSSVNNKPGVGKRISTAFGKMSDETKKWTVIGLAALGGLIVIVGVVAVFKFKKTRMDKKHASEKEAFVKSARESSGLPSNILPGLPGEAYERIITAAISAAQKRKAAAMSTTNPTMRLAESARAGGMLEVLKLFVPNDAMVYQITNGIRVEEYRDGVAELERDTRDAIDKFQERAAIVGAATTAVASAKTGNSKSTSATTATMNRSTTRTATVGSGTSTTSVHPRRPAVTSSAAKRTTTSTTTTRAAPPPQRPENKTRGPTQDDQVEEG